MKVVVVLPAYNEAGNITPLVTELARAGAGPGNTLRIVVVNDGSADATREELTVLGRQVPELRVVEHPTNLGLARALKTGISTACDERCDAAVFMDCDLSHRPDQMPRLVDALASGADVALGSRFVPGGSMVGVPIWRAAISRAGNLFGRLVLRIPIRDLTTGYRAMRRQVLEAVTLGEDGFTIQLEAIVKAYALGFRIVEVPIVLETRRFGASHMRYSFSLFRDYYRLLMRCRQWLREGRAAQELGRAS